MGLDARKICNAVRRAQTSLLSYQDSFNVEILHESSGVKRNKKANNKSAGPRLCCYMWHATKSGFLAAMPIIVYML